MKLKELLNGVEIISNKADLEAEISMVEYDSRKVKSGCLFVALRGTGIDGHKFIDSAFSAGSVCALIDEPEYMKENCILVSDSRKALSAIAANFYHNPASKFKIIGVTGTNGKTTTTTLIKQILEFTGLKVGLIGTIHNMIGKRIIETKYTTPEPLELQRLFAQMAEEKMDYVVMEVSSHSLAQDRVSGLNFEAAVFTNLTQDHLDFHKTMENYLLAKSKLFTMSKIGVINADDEAATKLMSLSTTKNYTYSAYSDKSDVVAKNIHYKPDGIEFELITDGQIGHAKLDIPGKFTVYNALAAITACLCLGIDMKAILSALATVKGVKGRIEVVDTGTDYTVLIDYAHTPDGLFNILSAIRGFARGRVVTLFGCGGDRDRTKRPIMGKIAFDMSDFCIVTSDNPRTEDPSGIIKDILEGVKDSKTPYVVIENRKEAIEYALRHARRDDTILLAGKGHETYQILKDRRIHFDEREIIHDILSDISNAE
ncbi:MAG: UDP-N-acetylmuramoyl-L-alanyl-D-glutamate--2,6-diaminopimelate ligase [Bacillota bacterium]|nr:UDP-N-acetylmuramoyl-L-alanyl-D-glutamate--2,6-diaminopimelate ligase [Bacillota bacterium]